MIHLEKFVNASPLERESVVKTVPVWLTMEELKLMIKICNEQIEKRESIMSSAKCKQRYGDE